MEILNFHNSGTWPLKISTVSLYQARFTVFSHTTHPDYDIYVVI